MGLVKGAVKVLSGAVKGAVKGGKRCGGGKALV